MPAHAMHLRNPRRCAEVLRAQSRSRPVNGQWAKGELSFVQISDSHMGFNKPANPDVAATLKAAVDKINALPTLPEFLLHTGDISHLSKPAEFDNVDQILKATGDETFFVPAERERFELDGKQLLGTIWTRSERRRLVQLRQKGRFFGGGAGEREDL